MRPPVRVPERNLGGTMLWPEVTGLHGAAQLAPTWSPGSTSGRSARARRFGIVLPRRLRVIDCP